jgi:FkbM family methyltransferase
MGGYSYKKYKGYNPVHSAEAMLPFVEWINKWSKLKISNVFEIGANFAQDADFMMKKFNLKPNDVYVFEAHPDLYKVITRIHAFHAYNNAVYNEEKEIAFNVIPLHSKNTGLSSLHGSVYSANKRVETEKVVIKSIRMDNFMKTNHINKIDFLKLDVEGVTHEVLEGFGDRMVDINCMHIEAEHIKDFYGSNIRLFDDIAHLLDESGFKLIYFQRYTSQSDSFWVREKFIKRHRLE